MVRSRRGPALALALALAACGDAPPPAETDADATSDAGTSGAESESGTSGLTDGIEVDWSFAPVRGKANLDDDDLGARVDWLELPFAEDDDIVALTLPELPPGDEVHLALAGDVERLRVWLARPDGASQLLVGAGNGEATVENTLAPDTLLPPGEPVTLLFEFGRYGVRGELTLTRLVDGDEVAADAIALEAAPLLLTDHTRPAERVWVVEVPEGCADDEPSSEAYVQGFLDALGPERVTVVAGEEYGCDRWLQDELEFAVSFDPDEALLETAMDSIRDRGLDELPEQLLGADFAHSVWGEGSANTYDYFGNLEVTPAVFTPDGEFPYGRVYYGVGGSQGPHTALRSFLEDQVVQAPLELDSSWLCVSHVDEWISFVPDQTAPRGFRMLYGDTEEGFAALGDVDPARALPRYAADHGYPTVGSILEDAALRAFNEELQLDHLEPIRAQLQAALALSPEEIVAVPMIFEELGGLCSGYATALVPGMVNLIVANFGPGDEHLLVPDPYVREALDDQDDDPLIAAFRARMPAQLEVHFVDDWSSYHLLYGDVHCGADVERAPDFIPWWE